MTCGTFPSSLLPGRVEVSDIVRAFSIGAVDYVTKPIRHEEICARVTTHIQLRKLMTIRDNLIEQLRQQNIDLERLAIVKEEQLERTEKLSHLGELVGELTHELATPLGLCNTAISTLADKNNKLCLDLEQNKLSKSALKSYLDSSSETFDIISTSINYSSQLVNGFKQIVVGEFSQACTDFDLKEFLQSIILIMTPRIKRSAQTIEISCQDDIQVTGLAGALSQVIINLINNAMTHAFDENQAGNITMAAITQVDDVLITLKDDGKGMSTEVSSKVFDKYFTTKMGSGGSGLGLFIVKNLVMEQLKGTIVCESIPGEGTCFTIRFPRKV